MDRIKHLFFNRFKTFFLISISMLLSIVLLMIRMKLTHSFFYLFLVWNLFLAVIPFAITNYLVSLPKLNKIGFALWFCVWLLFLPNAPYIVTDLMHLRLHRDYFLWLDILVVSSFAFNGLLLFYLSLVDWELLSNPKYLCVDIINIIAKPIENKEVWLFTILFGAFLSVGFWVFRQLSKEEF